MREQPGCHALPIGYFGASTCRRALRLAASRLRSPMVSEEKRPPQPGRPAATDVRAHPLIVGGQDEVVPRTQRGGRASAACEHRLVVVPQGQPSKRPALGSAAGPDGATGSSLTRVRLHSGRDGDGERRGDTASATWPGRRVPARVEAHRTDRRGPWRSVVRDRDHLRLGPGLAATGTRISRTLPCREAPMSPPRLLGGAAPGEAAGGISRRMTPFSSVCSSVRRRQRPQDLFVTEPAGRPCRGHARQAGANHRRRRRGTVHRMISSPGRPRRPGGASAACASTRRTVGRAGLPR